MTVSPTIDEHEAENRRRWIAFAVVAFGFFMGTVDVAIVNVALPTIARHLSFSEAGLQWVVTAYGLTFGGFLLLGGRAADLLGRRRVFSVGVALFTLASLAAGLSSSAATLVSARAVQGFGAAMLSPAALSIVRNMFTEGAERNKALGLWGAVGASGATVGMVAGGLLTRFAGWEWIFFINLPVGLAVLAMTRRFVPESKLETAKRRYDPLGALLASGGLLLLVYAISQAPHLGWGATRTIASIAGSVALLTAFAAVESQVEAPLVPLAIFRQRTLTASNITYAFVSAGFFGPIFITTLYMQQVLGYSALQAGIAWLAATVTAVAAAGPSQKLVTRTSPRFVLLIGTSFLAGGLALLSQVPARGHYLTDLLAAFILVGLGVAFSMIPINIAAMGGIVPTQAGLASGLLNTSGQIGGALGVAILASVASSRATTLLAEHHSRAAALTGGFQHSFIVASAFALLGLTAALTLMRRPRSAATPATQQPPALAVREAVAAD
jgi:EmrB/QacA subfamily drug resistance transporter